MNPAGYVLSTLEVILQTEENAMISEHTVTLRNASGGNPGSMLLATFVNPSSPTLGSTQQTFKFTLSEGVELDPDTPYFIHWVHNHATDRVKVAVTVSDNQDSGGLTDWGIDDVATVTTNLTSSGWINMAESQAIQMRLNGYAKTPAPVLSTAEVDGDELVLTYGEALDATSVPAAAAFTVTAGGTAVPVSTVVVSGMAVTLQLAPAVTAGQTVLLDYVVPSSNPLQNGSGSDAAALAGQAVVNRTPTAQELAERILVRNTGQTQEVRTLVNIASQAFRTGMNPAGYVLSSLELLLQSVDGVPISNFAASLRNASGSNPGEMVLATFVNPDSPTLNATVQTFRFTLSTRVWSWIRRRGISSI